MESLFLFSQLPALTYDLPNELDNSSPIFIPRKHTKQTYAAQRRAALKRRNNKSRK
jgi:hypothetical protein